MSTIRGLFAKDPRQAGDNLEARWSTGLFLAHRYNEAADFAQTAIGACIADPARVESLLRFRVRALISASLTPRAPGISGATAMPMKFFVFACGLVVCCSCVTTA